MKSKVLLIDDSVTIHRVIDLSIDVDRYDIVKVFSKEDAALKMQSEQFDYILLDNKLDNIIISEYIKELKSAQPSASIILLVGAFDRFDESDLEKTGADDYLVKPFDSQSLNEKLSSEADMMPAGIVEKIAEADYARDNDNYVAPAAALVTGEAIDGLSKQEYLENLEEVQPDDLTDNGYAEDLDTAASLEFDKLPKEAEQPLQQEDNNAEETPVENNIIEESPEEDTVVEESINTAEADKEISLDNAADNNPVLNEPNEREVIEQEPVSFEQQPEPENTDNADITGITDNAAEQPELNTEDFGLPAQDIQEPEIADMPEITATPEIPNVDIPNVPEVPDIPEIPDMPEVSAEENAPIDTDEIDIPEPVAVQSPVIPDIEDAENSSDEYIMKDNLADIDNQGEMLNEFPDFPDIDDVSTDEMQDNLDTASSQEQSIQDDIETAAPVLEEEISEETILPESISEEVEENGQEQPPVINESEEDLLVDDDDWLSDAPVNKPEESADILSEEVNAEQVSSDLFAEESIEETQPVQQELEEEPAFAIEENMPETDNLIPEEDIQSGEIAAQEAVNIDEVMDITEEIPEINAEQETAAIEEPVTESAVEEDISAEEIVAHLNNENKEEIADIPEEQESAVEENILPVQKEEIKQEPVSVQQSEVRQAETYSPETSGRFGGITVTISRDEIIAMLGNAIDKHFLEEAVKEVIAANMKDIVRNIVPAIAEKYIKEEIERLKNDE